MDAIKALTEFGVTTGLLLVSLYYIAYRTVPKHVYDKLCEQNEATVAALGRLSEQTAVLLDRERSR